MKRLLTVTAVVAASLALSTASFAGGSGGKNHNSAKSLTFALSGAHSRVRVNTGGGMPPAPPVRRKKRKTSCGGCGGYISVDAGSYQNHHVYSNHHGTGGSSNAGNYLNARWSGGAKIEYSGSAFAIGGAAIISGGKSRGNGAANPQ